MTDLLDRATGTAATAGRRLAVRAGKKVAVSLVGAVAFWIVLALALVFLVVAAAGGQPAGGAPLTAGAAVGGGQVPMPAGGDVTLVHAAQIVNIAYGRGLGRGAALIGVAVALAESGLYDYANDGTSTQLGQFPDGHRQLDDTQRATARESLTFPHERVGHDLDSMGLFQQRPSAGWGTPAQLMDPAVSAGKFYDALAKIPGWQAMTPAAAAQAVQGSNDPTGGIYAQVQAQAAAIVDRLGLPTGPGGPGGGSGAAVPVTGVQVPIPPAAGLAGTITAPTPTVARAVAAGLAWIGEPYSWNGGDDHGPTLGVCGPDGAQNDCHIVGFDCSGLMSYLWAQVDIHVDSYTQTLWDASAQIPWAGRQVGDMIGYGGGGSNHIALYVGVIGGVEMMLEAPYSGAYVRIAPVRDGHHPVVYRLWQAR